MFFNTHTHINDLNIENVEELQEVIGTGSIEIEIIK